MSVTPLGALRRLVRLGGWAPLLVFATHVVLHKGFALYAAWPSADVPMHFAGGVAMAYFVSRLVRALPHAAVVPARLALIEGVVTFTVTVTVAVFWEFAEFLLDQWVGSELQRGPADTMKDLAVGAAAAATFALVSLRRTTHVADVLCLLRALVDDSTR